MKLRTILIVLSLLIIAFIIYYTFQSPNLVSSKEAKELIQKKQVDVVLDVRTKIEYNLGHYPEALHIPTANLNDQVETLIPDKKTRILIYCNTGQRARYATDLLRGKGYKNVNYIAGSYLSLMR